MQTGGVTITFGPEVQDFHQPPDRNRVVSKVDGPKVTRSRVKFDDS